MNKDIKKVLVIGSGPVVIGQGSEFDYSGTQACIALREEGIKVVIINSNPVAYMTSEDIADSIYIEPLNIDIVKRIINIENPDSILPTMGGDKGLEIALELHQSGFLDENNIKLLSVNPELIYSVQNRQAFKKFLNEIGEPAVESCVVNNIEDALDFVNKIGLPVIVRPAYSAASKEADFCYTINELKEKAAQAIDSSVLRQIFLEKCISGWKELEYEIVRDSAGNCMSVSNLESIDPVGIHTGDSIIVTPSQTLSQQENDMLKASAVNIASCLGVEGSCNIQFALKPDGNEYAVLEVDPRTSRSSSFVSKVTGYPIAKVSAKLAVGYKLSEIEKDAAGIQSDCDEPLTNYCAVKFPTWSFDKFGDANRKLGTTMQSTGAIFAIGTNFEVAFMKAVRSINIGLDTPSHSKFSESSEDDIIEFINNSDDERIFAVYEALKRGVCYDKIYKLTGIDHWYLKKLKNIADMENSLKSDVDDKMYMLAKNLGFLDETIERLSGKVLHSTAVPTYKKIDAYATKFDKEKPYFYSAWDETCTKQSPLNDLSDTKRKILLFGAGPSTVGYGDELEYCNINCLKALKKLGYSTIVLNNNPDVNSTDHSMSDRLFIDPLTVEDARHVIEEEQPWGAIAQYSGVNAADLTKLMQSSPIKVLGAGWDTISTLADIEELHNILTQLGIPNTTEPKYNGTMIETDVIFDGDYCFIPAVVELIERANVNSGDSISVYPSITLNERVNELISKYANIIATHFGVKGIINIQFMLYDNRVYVTEVTYDTAHNIPFVSKATGLPIIEIAVRCMLGEKLSDMGYCNGIHKVGKLCAVRVPVFSFEKLSGADIQLGSQMKSTGEVLGIGSSFEDALLKGLAASGIRIKRSGSVLVSVRNSDKQEAIAVAEKFDNLGFNLFATAGTAKTLNSNFVATNSIRKIHEGRPNTLDLINGNKVVYVISTSEKGDTQMKDDVKIRRRALERQIPTFTTLETANALARCLAKKRSIEDIELVDIAKK